MSGWYTLLIQRELMNLRLISTKKIKLLKYRLLTKKKVH